MWVQIIHLLAPKLFVLAPLSIHIAADISIVQICMQIFLIKYRSKTIFTIIGIRAERGKEGLSAMDYKMVETVPEVGEEIVVNFKHICQ